ncbi:hypothetical protein OG394_38960 [Kribbella sp. NBC_01245]|uniref:hypothetical protein n=1 Tax=Kribbella sp. NBC_01245 TaxID=2903578 RepID=UPI002E29AF7A|nr:hypothetical protein [Kribbella sp. NBC_01245]
MRRTVISSSLLITGALVVAGTVATLSVPERDAAEPPGVVMRPACAPPFAIPASGASGSGLELSTTAGGTPAMVDVVIPPASGIRLVEGTLVVGAVDSTGGAGDPSALPSTAVLRPENQLAANAVTNFDPNDQRLQVTFQAAAAGRYPVYFIARYVSSRDCLPPAPPADAEPATTVVQRLGVVVAR